KVSPSVVVHNRVRLSASTVVTIAPSGVLTHDSRSRSAGRASSALRTHTEPSKTQVTGLSADLPKATTFPPGSEHMSDADDPSGVASPSVDADVIVQDLPSGECAKATWPTSSKVLASSSAAR